MNIVRVGHAIRTLASVDNAQPWAAPGLDIQGAKVLLYSQYGCWEFPKEDKDLVAAELRKIADLVEAGVPSG
jgi:hypothetical protein